MGFLIPLIGWPAAIALTALALWMIWDILHDGLWRRPEHWVSLLPFATLAVICLTVLGALPVLGGGIAAAVLAALFALAARLAPDSGRFLLWNLRELPGQLAADIRGVMPSPGHILRWVRRTIGKGAPPAGGGPVRVRATPGVPPWRRKVPDVPSVMADPALGAAPPPSEVAAALAAGGVMVPATWAAVAAEAADHDPDSDEEHMEHMDGEVAGILTWAEGAMARAENLDEGAGLDPAYISAQYELADAIADLASTAAQVNRRYHDTYDDIREAAAGKTLPRNPNWFGGGTAQRPGQAA